MGLAREAALELAPAVQNLTVRVAARTGAGEGPWSFPLPVPGPDREYWGVEVGTPSLAPGLLPGSLGPFGAGGG